MLSGNLRELQLKEYKEANYRVVETGSVTGRAIIFFSSNGIFYPDTIDTFSRVIIQEDKYEWEHIASCREIVSYYEKIILVRDILKQWYYFGINTKYDSVDRVLDLLRYLLEEKRYEITTCGSSAGGYMATVAGIRLGAKRIFNMSGQFSIDNMVDNCEMIRNELHDPVRNKYLSIIPLIDDHINNMYYFWPCKSEQDIIQHSYVEKLSVLSVAIDSDKHGSPITGGTYRYMLTASSELLRRLRGDTVYTPGEIHKFFLPKDMICHISEAFTEMHRGCPIVLYGAGKRLPHVLEWLDKHGLRYAAVIDSSVMVSTDAMKSKNYLKNVHNPVIIITSSKYYESIMTDIRNCSNKLANRAVLFDDIEAVTEKT